MSNDPAPSPRRVVITGVGLISPLGSSAAELADALTTGRSGVALRESAGEPRAAGIATQFTGAIGDFGELEGPQKKAIRKGLKLMCRETQMAVAAAQLALADSGGVGPTDPEKIGVVLGSDYMLTMPEDYVDAVAKCAEDNNGRFEYSRWGGDGLGDMQPLWMLKYLPNMPASHIAIYNDLRGPNNSLTMREAGGLMAVGEATRILQRGSADRMIAGATGTRVLPMQAIHALQTEPIAGRTDAELAGADPASLSRPFAEGRMGMVCGEGAGMVQLETLESAQARGAKVYGEVLGYGSSIVSDAQLMGRNDIALANAMRAALQDAGRQPGELSHVNADGIGTPEADLAEAQAIRTALGDAADDAPVVALKSYFGALGAGSGVVELIGSLLAFESGELPVALNADRPDPACPIRLAESGAPAGDLCLAINTTPQGQAAAICVSRFSQ